MCGIVGVINGSKVVDDLMGGLELLEYRGYDSAGLAIVKDKHVYARKTEGALANLKKELAINPIEGRVGIAHTRWATHGEPTVVNAHPHSSQKVTVVHNGIIENYEMLREDLEYEGYEFVSDTDSEVVPHLISLFMDSGALSPEAAAMSAVKMLDGAYALGILFEGEEEFFCAARKGSPLAIGYGDEAMYVASDAMALAPMTDRVSYLADGDFAVLSQGNVEIYDVDEHLVQREVRKSSIKANAADKGHYAHFMLKEIHEQPDILLDIVETNLGAQKIAKEKTVDFAEISSLRIIACGTSFYAGHVAKYWFERYANLNVEIDIASEFRYRNAPLPENGAALFISQSGETADTFAALEYAKSKGQKILSLVNVPESTIARASDYVVLTEAGSEIGVASTKAFTAQLAALAMLVIEAGKARGVLSAADERELTGALKLMPAKAQEILKQTDVYQDIAQSLKETHSALFIGRGASYPLALEGALKLKEISYIHAEGIGAGELKHGPIALIDKDTPVIAVAPPGELAEKTLSNIKEVQARGGPIILISDAKTIAKADFETLASVEVPECHDFIAPFLYVLPLQLLSYYAALARDCNIDKPRNLAKSVTVE
ncbi:MAG: glutamine--fructose-6-phosphate transaminase (isomerizing) [Alphaproteobacteria bacterium]|nr:MAG: glutamine--fructose-6-phosphate transaminase (isomerizing) [Alphaproteobacteria bacterium]